MVDYIKLAIMWSPDKVSVKRKTGTIYKARTIALINLRIELGSMPKLESWMSVNQDSTTRHGPSSTTVAPCSERQPG